MSRGGEESRPDVEGRTPLHWAAYKNHTATLKLLLVMDARAEVTDEEGCTPLHWAAIKGNSDSATILLQVRPSLTVRPLPSLLVRSLPFLLVNPLLRALVFLCRLTLLVLNGTAVSSWYRCLFLVPLFRPL